jgi:hypothetical protein
MQNKVMKSSSTPFVKGGSTKMAGKQSAGAQTPGISGTQSKGSGGKFPMGGKTKMAGKQSARPAKSC